MEIIPKTKSRGILGTAFLTLAQWLDSDYRREEAQLYVGRGVGTTALPVCVATLLPKMPW